MEGFLNIRVRPWLRRLVTRLLAIMPAFIVIWLAGSARHVPASAPEPGGAEPAAAVRHHSADSLHQRSAGAWASSPAAGRSAARRMGHGDRRPRPQYVAGRANDRRLGRRCRCAVRRSSGPSRSAICAALCWACSLDRHAALPAALAAVPPPSASKSQNRPNWSPSPQLPPHSGAARSFSARPHGARPRRRPGHAQPRAASICCTWKKASPARSTGRMPQPPKWKPAANISTAWSNRLARWRSTWKPPSATGRVRRKEIVRYAREIQPDLLVMGAHGHRRI